MYYDHYELDKQICKLVRSMIVLRRSHSHAPYSEFAYSSIMKRFIRVQNVCYFLIPPDEYDSVQLKTIHGLLK